LVYCRGVLAGICAGSFDGSCDTRVTHEEEEDEKTGMVYVSAVAKHASHLILYCMINVPQL
jgi:hypothetical protein